MGRVYFLPQPRRCPRSARADREVRWAQGPQLSGCGRSRRAVRPDWGSSGPGFSLPPRPRPASDSLPPSSSPASGAAATTRGNSPLPLWGPVPLWRSQGPAGVPQPGPEASGADSTPTVSRRDTDKLPRTPTPRSAQRSGRYSRGSWAPQFGPSPQQLPPPTPNKRHGTFGFGKFLFSFPTHFPGLGCFPRLRHIC